MKKELQELFTQFDEEGFAPTIPMPNAEARAVEWKAAVMAEIEKLEKKWKNAIVPPVKLGETIYVVRWWPEARVEEWRVREFLISILDRTIILGRYKSKDINSVFFSEIGKRWFTDKKDAEAVVEELRARYGTPKGKKGEGEL